MTIRYLNWEGSIQQIKLMERVVDEFNKTSKDTKVILDSSAGTQKLHVQLAADAGPDVFYYCDIGSLVLKNTLEPLDGFIRKYNYPVAEDFPCALNAMTFEGKTYALPLNLSTQCVIYNKDIFDKAGVPYPKPGWTWDDYLHTAKALTKKASNGRIEQFGSLSIPFVDLLYQNGGRIAHMTNGAWKVELDSHEAKDAIRFALAVSKYAPRLSDKQSYGDNLGNLFTIGRVGMFVCPTAGLVGFSEQAQFKWNVAPIPDPPGKKAVSMVGVGGLCVNARSRHKDAAFKFAMFYCGPRGQQILAEGKNCLPSKVDVARTTFLSGLPKGAGSYIDLAQGTTVDYAKGLRGHWDETNLRAITPFLEEMYYGKKSPDEALKAMAKKTREVLAGSPAGH